MRKLIAGMKISLDGSTIGPDGHADWVESWAEDYGLTPDIDACLLGGGMYPGYEQYWTAVAQAPTEPLPMTERLPTQRELEWSRFAQSTPHYVLSTSLTSTNWSNTTILKTIGDIEALKAGPGKSIYLVGGASLTSSLIDQGLVDELRLIVFPLIAGGGKPLFAEASQRRAVELLKAEGLDNGCVRLDYALKRSITAGG